MGGHKAATTVKMIFLILNHANFRHGSKMKDSPLQCTGFAKQHLFSQPRSTWFISEQFSFTIW
jgi:hypothetical protein